MNFLKRLKAFFNPQQQVATVQLPLGENYQPIARRRPILLPSPTRRAYLPALQGSNQLNTQVQPDSFVIVFYFTETGDRLAKPQIVSGVRGQAFNFTVHQFEHYYVSRIENYHGYFAYPRAIIQLIYAQQPAAPVIVFHFDEQHHLLAQPEYLVGQLGQRYETHFLESRQYQVQHVTTNQIGHFSQQTQIVTYDYRLRQIRWANRYLTGFVRLTTDVTSYRAPDAEPLAQQLPINTVWRVYQKVQTTQRQTWYDLGGQWIPTENTERVVDYYQQPQPKALAAPLFQQAAVIPGSRRAVVDFIPQHSLRTWTQPYGNAANYLQHGQIVNIIHGVILSNNSVWYELEDHTWLEEHYVRLLSAGHDFTSPIKRLH
ncbi:MucBP domain-containing protein [Loigolactobacillus jiayinensis]|uniref:MucBP domain-containing protein n=1 Tax=Loigolactobacillus jiayinensis TaxID=2486016 RepID=A0ABW1R9N9_9LACO|nr:MucBP domain-containing protein [Loigolactobacillus jiayinensis]